MRLKDALKTLYYDTGRKAVDRKTRLKKRETEIGGEWRGGVNDSPRSRYLVYLTLLTFLFFLMTVAAAYLVQYAGIDRTVSTDKIGIVVQGPAVVDGGSVASLTLRVANRNPVPIQEATLTVVYPEGSYRKGDDITRLYREEFILGTVAVGEAVNRFITPLLYGKTGERKEIRYSLEYRVEGSAEPVIVRNSYDILLRNSPVLLSQPKHTSPVAGKDISFTLTMRSNTAETIPAVCLEAVYPSGFTPKRYSQRPTITTPSGALWKMTAVSSRRDRVVNIEGGMHGEERDEQSFTARAIAAPTGACDEGVTVAEESVILVVAKSFLGMDVTLNRSDSETIVASSGDRVNAEVVWVNQDTDRIQDLVITAHLTGPGLDESSISSTRGYFDEATRRLIWDQRQMRSFSSVRSGDGGSFSFSFRVLPDRVEFSAPEKYIRVSISAEADRVKTNARERVNDVAVAQVNVRSNLRLLSDTLYATGMIPNTGPIPPKVGERTSYILKYFVKNSGNAMADFTMRIPFGRDAVFTGAVSGLYQGEWRYDKNLHTIEVTLPSIAPSGPQSSRSIELQVAVEPRSRDVGEEIVLAKEAGYSARDSYTNELFEGSARQLTTKVTAEPLGFSSGVVLKE